MLPRHNTRFEIQFSNGHSSHAVHVHKTTPPEIIADYLNIQQPIPAIFVTGGASNMSAEDIQMTEQLIETLVLFVEEIGAVMIDGGTTSGVMQMIGKARAKHKLRFSLIGVCPMGKVSYPGHTNPDAEAHLEANHSHFVLIDGDLWGDESEIILGLTRVLSGNGKAPGAGILINGGNISRQEVYLAATKDFKLPMLIVEGSGRVADEIATAFKTGRANQRIMQAILAGGDIQLVSTLDGPDALRGKLVERFGKQGA
jgi:hypothetical protein